MYTEAGLGPRDMEFIQAYDDYPVIVMLQLEELGFCAKGEAPRFVQENVRPARDAHEDAWTLNTNGGQLSMGQAGAAGGFLGMVEGIRQITGQTLGGAASGAWTGLVSGYGTVNYDRGLCTSAAILVGGDGQ